MQFSRIVEHLSITYEDRLILANKGNYLMYSEIPNVLAAIDMSSNGFQGRIPPVMGTLKMINVLNL
uniref:Uncharacterized protein n=1 Tax=Rhizophora mucronata TaxID=61149 RepID=A0A2P2NTQ5_RHIMU